MIGKRDASSSCKASEKGKLQNANRRGILLAGYIVLYKMVHECLN